MNALVLCLPLLFADPASIEFAWAQATACEPQEQSVVTAPAVKPPAKPAPKFKTVMRFKLVKKTRCTRDRWGRKSCQTYYESVPYTVQVPVNGAWPHYPTTNKRIYRLNGGRGSHADWQHLTEGEHKGKFNADWLKTLSQAEIEALHSDDHQNKIQWAYVVRP